MMNCYKSDIYRYYGECKAPFLLPPEVEWIKTFRKAKNTKNRLLLLFYKLKLRYFHRMLHIQIPLMTTIGEGFYIGHTGRVIINSMVRIGKNCNIATGVTIGAEQRGRRTGAPTIGSEVWIGTNAVIVGKINIGNDVMIAPNAFVNFDVPDHSIVIGNPAKVIHKMNATEGYIKNKV